MMYKELQEINLVQYRNISHMDNVWEPVGASHVSADLPCGLVLRYYHTTTDRYIMKCESIM
jgi:hypothetical protein